MSIEIGDRVKDIVSGCKGIVVGSHKWLTGCDTVTVRPEEMKDGKPGEASSFDVVQLEVVKKAAVSFPNMRAADTSKIPGGPKDAVSLPNRSPSR